MRLTADPDFIREQMAQKKRWLTMNEISDGLNISRKTIRKALNGEPVAAATVRSVADAIGVENVLEIAEFVRN